jgi:hypothetical protein
MKNRLPLTSSLPRETLSQGELDKELTSKMFLREKVNTHLYIPRGERSPHLQNLKELT